ncbi:MAG: hypothetical protein R6U32_02140 [Candidatus Woesearchaeota archaeon]
MAGTESIKEMELIKMSSKGQLVVPEGVREIEGFKPGERFAAFPVKDGVLFKKVKIPDVNAEFENLSKEIEEKFKKQKIKKKDIAGAVNWAKKE